MAQAIPRRTLLAGTAAAIAVAAAPSNPARAAEPVTATGARQPLAGPSIEIDPTFSYYLDRSVDSVADEIAANGYRTVRYFVVNELDVNGPLIDAFHRRGIAVWALVVGNGSYAVADWPDGWPDWQMELVTPVDEGGFHFFSPFSADYVRWKKHLAATLVTEHPFDGYEIAEPYFPEWDGLTTGVYGDVGPLAQRAFQNAYQLTIPNFTDPSSPAYYKTDSDRYQKWVQFRVDGVIGYVNEIINGSGGVRGVRPDIKVATWSLGIDAGPDSVALEREFEGLDAGAMVRAVRPDLHILQTNWPDWTKPDLPPDYVTAYQPFVDQIRASNHSVPIGVQTDIGSQLPMARRDDWIRTFAATTRLMKLATWTAYEYHIGGYTYADPPVPRSAKLGARGQITVSFTKRIDAHSAAQAGSFELISPAGSAAAVPANAVSVDGNRVTIKPTKVPDGQLRLAIRNVTDAPQYWLYNTSGPANVVPAGTTVTISPVR